MSLAGAFSGQLLKVSYGSDVRRLKLDLPSCVSMPEEVFSLLRKAIVEGFDLAEAKVSSIVLKYADDEGDLCTLTEHTILDLAGQLPKDILRLSMEILANSSTELPAEASGHRHGHESAPQRHSAGSDAQPHTSTGEPSLGANPDVLADLAMQFLPMLAAHASAPNQRLEGNKFGVAKRDVVLQGLQNTEERLDRLPETRHLKPALRAYMDGTDILHFGDLCADVLQAWSIAADRAGVRTIVSEAIKDAMAAHPLVGQWARFAEQMQQQQQQQHGAAEGKGWDAKGQGKGSLLAAALNSGMMGAQEGVGALQGLLLGGKGSAAGPHPGVQQRSAASPGFPLGVDALQGLLGGLGGLGGQQQTAAPQGLPPGMDVLPGLLGGLLGAAQAGGGFPFPATAASPEATAPDTDLEQNAAALVEMQLATDLEAARALLRHHGGDVSAVIGSFE